MKSYDVLFMLSVVIMAGSIISRMDLTDPLDIQRGMLAFTIITLCFLGYTVG